MNYLLLCMCTYTYKKNTEIISRHQSDYRKTLGLLTPVKKRFTLIKGALDSRPSGLSEDSVLPNSQVNIVCDVIYQKI